MTGHAAITVFQYPEGPDVVVVVRVSVVETSTGEHCHSHEIAGERSLAELLSAASDAVLAWRKHGTMFAEPLASGWQRGI